MYEEESTKSRQKDGYGRLTGTDDELVDQSDVNGNAVTARSGLELSSVSHGHTFADGARCCVADAEALTCDVCDRAFVNTWQLHCHQAKKRHYGCSTCEGVFPSLLALEAHKEENHHWSDEDLFLDDNDDEEDEDENDYETGFYDDDEDDEEERENLL
ncbi:Zinc finger C2H2-type [Trinorchestia longiramus]|nr:Zinc finger C2H2-type [Trinorchestia longiramus]